MIFFSYLRPLINTYKQINYVLQASFCDSITHLMKNFHVLSESKQKKIIAYASIKVSKRSDVCAHFAPLIVDHVNSNNFCSQTMRSSAEFPTGLFTLWHWKEMDLLSIPHVTITFRGTVRMCGWGRQRKNIDESYEFYQTFYIIKLPRNWSQIWSSIHLYRYQGLTFGTELSFAGVIGLL